VLVNIGEEWIGKPLPDELRQLTSTVFAAPAKLELELQELSEEDRQTFMEGLGLKDFSRDDTLRNLFAAMGMIVFFTIGEDECRAWAIPKGASAVEGAGQIHTDFAAGFVRAEVVTFSDFQKYPSMKDCKAHGVYRLEGKTYIVQDGDIMHILANR
jgi:ribosome-binding ATPase YchF (GTP1/OBG family)